MVGIQNITTVTYQNITAIGNITGDPTEFFINVNTIVFCGWLYFILLCVLWWILFQVSQDKNDQLMINLMTSGTVVTILSFLLRAIEVYKNGIYMGLLNDYQMWIFPLATALIATYVWATKDY